MKEFQLQKILCIRRPDPKKSEKKVPRKKVFAKAVTDQGLVSRIQMLIIYIYVSL